jgi:hypothetical protein
MVKVKEAKRSDLAGLDGKRNMLGGPSYSHSALEMFMVTPDFAVLVAGGAAVVVYHEGPGGRSQLLLLVGEASADLLEGAEGSSRRAGAERIALEAAPDSPALPQLESAGYRRVRNLDHHFGKDRPALLLEKNL